ncbi:TOBE domain-containing protein [Ramlibacter sp. 2FC]|uniref:TOBE domain-containing protein n=1 Tax=Ramlibacter sp. 2FC TaxID=2502188 RepID=UPI0010F870A8|nr:TOBE domain-containing protein [Ramlibacter sp. 2FC]
MSAKAPSAIGYTAALSHASADKRVEILRLVGRSGSISQAGREAGVSYKAAWQAIDTLTNLAGVALVERVVGGAGGGGARITPAGLQLLAAADQLEQARSEVLARLQGREPGAARVGLPALSQLSVRTSMRNQLPCTVQALEDQGQIMRVRLQLADGAVLVSRITRESAELLGLREGQPVLALCKATAVTVCRVADAQASLGANLLPGRASRVSRGQSGDEVAAALDAGLQLVGFAPPASGLRSGSRIAMTLDESAVVIALPG